MLLVSRIRYTPRPLHDLYYVYIRLTGRTAAEYVKAQDKTRQDEKKSRGWHGQIFSIDEEFKKAIPTCIGQL